jgi:glycine cleavage system H protein
VIPPDLKYSETHEWIKIVNKNTATVGITAFAVSKLSDLVHIELPKVGDKVEQGQPFGEIESVKTVSELISPLSGRIQEINKEVVEHVATITDEPYEDGWLIKIRYSEPAEMETLMSAAEYEEFIKSTEGEEGGKSEDEDDVDEEYFV